MRTNTNSLLSTGLDGEVNPEQDEMGRNKSRETCDDRVTLPEAKPEQGVVAKRVEREHLPWNSKVALTTIET